MKKNLLLLVFLPFLGGCASDGVINLGKDMLSNLIWVVPFVAAVIVIIFAMNKFIVKNGRTHDRMCSIVGLITFPALFVGGIGIKFGFGIWPVSIAVVLGAIIGWFSYTIDELLGDFWSNRSFAIPAALGLVMAGYMTTALFTHVWLEGDMYVTHKACAKRAIIERYTYHYKKDGSSYSWDYESHTDRFNEGWTLPVLKEGRDYKLGRGAMMKKDRVKWEQYYFIGGHFYSEKKKTWEKFEWLLLSKEVPFQTGKVQRVESDYFGHPFNNAGERRPPKAVPRTLKGSLTPGSDQLPNPTGIGKVLGMGVSAVKLLFTEAEYRVLMWIHLAFGAVLVFIYALVPPLRSSIQIFVICASIVILLLLMVVAARTGNLDILKGGGSRRFSGGGGRSGGGGASGRW